MIVHVASQRARLELPFLLDNAICLVPYALEDRNVLAAKVTEAANGAVLHESHQVQSRSGSQIPLHVGKYLFIVQPMFTKASVELPTIKFASAYKIFDCSETPLRMLSTLGS